MYQHHARSSCSRRIFPEPSRRRPSTYPSSPTGWQLAQKCRKPRYLIAPPDEQPTLHIYSLASKVAYGKPTAYSNENQRNLAICAQMILVMTGASMPSLALPIGTGSTIERARTAQA
jgi:hypothetical protein